jgi:hypothetical protein
LGGEEKRKRRVRKNITLTREKVAILIQSWLLVIDLHNLPYNL